MKLLNHPILSHGLTVSIHGGNPLSFLSQIDSKVRITLWYELDNTLHSQLCFRIESQIKSALFDKHLN